MTDICKYTGELIESPETVKQAIGTILTTPKGTRLMRAAFGFDGIDRECQPKPGLTKEQAETMARETLEASEPRATFDTITAEFAENGLLSSIEVDCTIKDSDQKLRVTVPFPPSGDRHEY